MNKTKLKWMGRIAKARNYVILDDKQSVISVKGLTPNSFLDEMKATQQQATLVAFRNKLDKVIKDYEKAIAKQFGTKTKKKTVKKIQVKQG